MEGTKDMALADYENLSDEEKVRIHNTFMQAIADGNFSQNSLYSYSLSEPEFVDKCLETYKGYTKGSFDFNDFITLRFILAHESTVLTCDGCSSLILGHAFFSCHECFFHDPDRMRYDLCCSCYASKKFKGHNHTTFYDSRSLLDESKRMFYAEKTEREGMSEFINGVMLNLAGDVMEIATSIKSQGWKTYNRIFSNFDRNEKLSEISNRLSQLNKQSHATETSTKYVEEEERKRESSSDLDEEENSNKNWASSWRVSQDVCNLLGAKPSRD